MYYVANSIYSMKENDFKAGDIVVTMDTNDLYTINEILEYVKIHSESSCNRDRPTNCKNCGAVLTSYKCEYCGTEY